MKKSPRYLRAHKSLVESGRRSILGPLVAQSARAALEKIVKEDYTPSAGIYYCLRNPDGWEAFSYRFDEYPECDHSELWESYCAPILAQRWSARLKKPAAQLERQLSMHSYAFPRGRVARPHESKAAMTVMHGGDTPKGISSSTINRLFSLSAATKWVRDEHERCQADDRDAVRSILKLTETWPAVTYS
jgi:hypothetical protein